MGIRICAAVARRKRTANCKRGIVQGVNRERGGGAKDVERVTGGAVLKIEYTVKQQGKQARPDLERHT